MFRTSSSRKLILPALVARWEQVDSFSKANQIMAVLKPISTFPEEVLVRLEKAYQANNQLHGSGFVSREFPILVKRIRASVNKRGKE